MTAPVFPYRATPPRLVFRVEDEDGWTVEGFETTAGKFHCVLFDPDGKLQHTTKNYPTDVEAHVAAVAMKNWSRQYAFTRPRPWWRRAIERVLAIFAPRGAS